MSRREHSRTELCQKLHAKGFAPEATAEVVNELTREGWQSDSRFAESLIRQRIRSGYGPIHIAYELRQRGIDHYSGMDALVEELAGSWDELLARIYSDKYPENKQMTRNEWVKRVRFMQRRGFAYESIRFLGKRLNLKFEV